MKLINDILTRKEFAEKPPVLIDIGASEGIHNKWKEIAKYSICIAFDADQRDFSFTTKESAGYKKLISYNCIVTEDQGSEFDFYLTQSPYCSSLLKPDNESLKAWAFSEKFNVLKAKKIKTKSLQEVFAEQKFNYLDWFKSDSQGTDLRLFKSLGQDIIKKVLSVELEPGIIDSYHGEDKISMVLSFMNENNFLLSEMNVKGSQRITTETLNLLSKNKFFQKFIHHSHKSSPGWAELFYINNQISQLEIREHFLGWIIAVLQKQYGYSFEIAESGFKKFEEPLFNEMKDKSIYLIKSNLFKIKFLPSAFVKLRKSL